ncbi:PREDICTED: protein pitchfork-like [Priapulus caudatus]|uniref:Protein pitchfork-like n=1 Tax=Priapulus caudatus TaxID=37621 RepID=A0ABM1ED14_PRICU|nr:PREDICTED: protein pitchfork-like [Priapulus caudatus]
MVEFSFGTTLDRQLLPTKLPPTKAGIFLDLRGEPNRGPGSYNNHVVSSFVYEADKHITSKKGYSLAARTGPRLAINCKELPSPSPCLYQKDRTEVIKSQPAKKPFLSGSSRFPLVRSHSLPGPGTYEHEVRQNRRLSFHGSFTGQQTLRATVLIKCTTNNDDKCDVCRARPVGDYYCYRREVLCRQCFEFHLRYGERYAGSHLQAFKKVRDCRFMHDHQGTSAAIKLLTARELKKQNLREAYLSLYHC